MSTYRTRNLLARTSPLRSILLFQPVSILRRTLMPAFVPIQVAVFTEGRGVLAAGLSLGAPFASARINSRAAKKSPDADLLALCARLAAMQAEWQRLWHFTSEDWGLDDPPATAADREWLAYNDHVWPAIHISGQAPRHPDDLPGHLLDFRPVTVEGMRAKAAAVLAMDDAACYGADARNDACEMYQSVLVDAAGTARMLMGEDAQVPTPPLPGCGAT